MGSGRFDANDWQNYSTSQNYASKNASQIFNTSGMDPDMDPKTIKFRESRDSGDNPESTAVMIGLDDTSSMGMICEVMAKKGIPTLLTEIYDRKPVHDPHVLCAAIGDVRARSQAPLQVTQFEADIRMTHQLEKLYLEGGGGGNGSESYGLLWYFAAMKTKIDCFEKRQKKGYLFTIGDDGPTPDFTAQELETVFGPGEYQDIKAEDLLTLVSRQWEVFHVIVKEGQTYDRDMQRSWEKLLGERAIILDDHTKLAEVITSVIQVNEGADRDSVAKSWDGTTSLVVAGAIKNLPAAASKGQGVVTL